MNCITHESDASWFLSHWSQRTRVPLCALFGSVTGGRIIFLFFILLNRYCTWGQLNLQIISEPQACWAIMIADQQGSVTPPTISRWTLEVTAVDLYKCRCKNLTVAQQSVLRPLNLKSEQIITFKSLALPALRWISHMSKHTERHEPNEITKSLLFLFGLFESSPSTGWRSR